MGMGMTVGDGGAGDIWAAGGWGWRMEMIFGLQREWRCKRGGEGDGDGDRGGDGVEFVVP